MSSLAVLIPVKSSGGKSRLAPVLSRSERRELGLLLLSGVLRALGGAGLLAQTHVVTSDPEIMRLAAGSGALCVREAGDEGVNAAVEAGVRALNHPSRVLVLPSDLPFLGSPEIKHLTWLSQRLEVVIAPSAPFDGTNALVFPPDSGLPLSYDRDSFWNHLRASGRKGFSVGVSSEPGLCFDLDSPEDLRTLARSKARSPAVQFARRVSR
jgi:2-phospho-L-lactate guanylyltransferase